MILAVEVSNPTSRFSARRPRFHTCRRISCGQTPNARFPHRRGPTWPEHLKTASEARIRGSKCWSSPRVPHVPPQCRRRTKPSRGRLLGVAATQAESCCPGLARSSGRSSDSPLRCQQNHHEERGLAITTGRGSGTQHQERWRYPPCREGSLVVALPAGRSRLLAGLAPAHHTVHTPSPVEVFQKRPFLRHAANPRTGHESGGIFVAQPVSHSTVQ